MMHHNPSQFGAESEYLRPLQGVIVHIDAQIMNGFIFKVNSIHLLLSVYLL